MEESQTIHTYHTHHSSSFYLFLLLIPAVFFLTILAFVLSKTPVKSAAIDQVPSVLGEETTSK